MQVLTMLRETIDLHSFSNLWFWVVLAVMWSRTSHRVMGVPWDMVIRARRRGEAQMISDVVDLAAIYSRRTLYVSRAGGGLLTAAIFGMLSLLATLGFHYGLQFAQAVILLIAPLGLIWLLNLRTARRLERGNTDAAGLFALLMRQRVYIQLIGMVAIFVTSLWGMYQNLFSSVLGN